METNKIARKHSEMIFLKGNKKTPKKQKNKKKKNKKKKDLIKKGWEASKFYKGSSSYDLQDLQKKYSLGLSSNSHCKKASAIMGFIECSC